MKLRFISTYLLTILLTGLPGTGVHAQESPWKFTLGGKVHFSHWNGDNAPSETDFQSDAGQLRINARLSKERFYAGLGIQGSRYHFKDEAPDMVSKTTLTPVSDTTVVRGESDIVVGYYFFQRVSFFLDLKSISLNYSGEDYKLDAGGLGFGANGYVPVNQQWLFYWSLGWFGLDVKHKSDNIGNAKGTGSELGFLYRVDPRLNFSVSLKGQSTKYDFDQGAEQSHKMGGLAVGASYTF